MKSLLTGLLLFLTVSVMGQGTSVRSDSGLGTNISLWGLTKVGSLTTPNFHNEAGLMMVTGGVHVVNGQIKNSGGFKADTAGRVEASSFNATNTGANIPGFVGDGSGLTNLAVLTTNNIFINNVTNNNLSVTNNAFINSITVTNNSFFKGNAQFTSNAYFLNLNFTTNLATTLVIAVGQTAQAVQTNNNINFTGYSGIDGTNAQPFTLLITNTAGSAAPKFYQFPAGTIMLSSPYTNGVYNTNQGAFSGWIYPGFGTNATWSGN